MHWRCGAHVGSCSSAELCFTKSHMTGSGYQRCRCQRCTTCGWSTAGTDQAASLATSTTAGRQGQRLAFGVRPGRRDTMHLVADAILSHSETANGPSWLASSKSGRQDPELQVAAVCFVPISCGAFSSQCDRLGEWALSYPCLAICMSYLDTVGDVLGHHRRP